MDDPAKKNGPPGAGESPVVYCLAAPGDAAEQELGRFEVRDRIRAGTIDEETPIRLKGTREWRRAGDLPELGRYFELAREGAARKRAAAPTPPAAALGESCRNHPGQLPTHVCTSCGAVWCGACVVLPAPGTAMPPLCPVDRFLCQPIVYERPAEPLLERALAAVSYPFAAGGLGYLFFYSLLRAFGSLWAFFPPPTLPLLLLLFIAWTYDLEIIRASAGGERALPRYPEVEDIWSTLARGVKVLLVTLICWAPFLLCGAWAVSRVAASVGDHVSREMRQPPPAEAIPAEATPPESPVSPGGPVPTMAPEMKAALEQLERLQKDLEAQRGRAGKPGPGAEPAAPGDRAPRSRGLDLGRLFQHVVATSIPYLILLLVVGLLCYSYFWMCLAYAAVWDTVFPALNPSRIVASIRACGTDYLLFLGLALGSTLVLLLAHVLLGVIPYVGVFLAVPIEAALSFWVLHLLGWMVLRHQVDLDWD